MSPTPPPPARPLLAGALAAASFVWAALLGYRLFGEVPSARTAASARLIVAGCLLLLRR